MQERFLTAYAWFRPRRGVLDGHGELEQIAASSRRRNRDGHPPGQGRPPACPPSANRTLVVAQVLLARAAADDDVVHDRVPHHTHCDRVEVDIAGGGLVPRRGIDI